MRYIMLIYDDEKATEGMPEEEMAANMSAWFG